MGNTKRKAFEKHLILLMCLILTVGLMPSTALADESYPDVTTPVYAGVEPGQTPVVDVGNVTVSTSDPSNTFAVYSHARNDTDATVNVHGSTTFEGTTTRGGTSAWARSTSGTSTIDVEKDVTVDLVFEEGGQHDVFGVDVSSEGAGAKTVADIGGDVVAKTTRGDSSNATIGTYGVVQAAITNPGEQSAASQIVLHGNVTAEAATTSGESIGSTSGLSVTAGEASKASTTVMGDVAAKGATAFGVQASGSSSSSPSEATVMIGGNVIAESNSDKSDAHGLELVATNSLVTVSIGGDVTSTSSQNNAIGVSGSATKGAINLLIEGTLTARKVGVVNASKDGQFDVTVWKIDSDIVGGKFARPFEYEEDAATEKAINYIIKVEQPQEGNILKLVGTTLKEFTTLDGKRSFDVANMDQKVYLNVEEGWIITAAFNGKGDKIALEKDDQGWFVIVPNGGGVYLSAQVAKAGPAPTPTPVPSPTPAYNPGSDDEAGYLPATGDSPIAAMVLTLAAMASLALGLFAASRMNGRRSRS